MRFSPHPSPLPKGEGKVRFRMPAEWEPHAATWLAWPHDLETWPKQLEKVKAAYLEIIEQLHVGENVQILVDDRKTQDYVLQKLRQRGIIKNVGFHLVETDSIWIRDYGPIFVTESGGYLQITNWIFNAWGRKYDSYQKDNLVPDQIAKILNVRELKADLVLEGGSIEGNGLGTFMTTEECLLNPNRNPHLKRDEIEQRLKDFLGAKKIIWLEKGIEGDDTDGHIDEVARFVAADTVVMSVHHDLKSYNGQILKENWRRLKQETDQNGKPFKMIELPMPNQIHADKMILPASYANFYIGNKCVLVPTFNDPNDSTVLGIMKDLFPGRSVAGIQAVPLIHGQGAIHCITQQEPIHAD